MRCKACDCSLNNSHDDTYCRKCINASNDVDVYNDTVYRNNNLNNDLKLHLFIIKYERNELLNIK